MLLLMISTNLRAQISPGDLAQVHTQLEGMSNCTQCHELGKQVSNEKCLNCHSELKKRISEQKGYHVSSSVRGKSCTMCHSDHHGLNFKIVRFEEAKFDHKLTSFPLTGAHARKQCKDCHKAEFIVDKEVKKKKYTYLGLDQKCLGCHVDYHQKTLSSACDNCHTFESFKPAAKFNHAKAKFQLQGKHQEVACIKCHKIETRDSKKFQVFTGIPFKSCVNCHDDPHRNQFGQQCNQCHSEVSFHTIKELNNFDHSKTQFKLEGKHQVVACKACHVSKITTPLKHDRCVDCHKDYHEGQFVRQSQLTDCSSCHNTDGFVNSSYSLDQHNQSNFPLTGAHMATPCISCHKKAVKWSFRKIGLKCADCHKDIHSGHISAKYYPDTACNRCHVPERWNIINFDHAVTDFKLTGAHAKQSCRTCHYYKNKDSVQIVQRFSELTNKCSACHKDQHNKQFDINGNSDCGRCHGFDNWKILNFNHNNTAFKLEGKHATLSCDRCHKRKTVGEFTFINYKIPDVTCKTCH